MPIRLLLIALMSLTVATAASAVDVFVTATTGQPYGIASIEIPIDRPVLGKQLPPIEVTEESGRVLYPISADVRQKVSRVSSRPVPQPGRGRLLGRVGNLIREITGGEEAMEQTLSRRVFFLVRGNAPVRVQLGDASGPIGQYEIQLTNDAAARQKLMNEWWSSYTAAAHRQAEAAKYPTVVESYLVAMLSGRTGMPLPDWFTSTDDEDDALVDTLKLIGGAQGVSDSMFRRAAAGHIHNEQANLPLPAAPNWAPMFEADNLDDVAVEPLAKAVPPECFYIRYGSFANYMWFRDLSQDYGGDISRMVTLNGIADDSAGRIERQLNLKTTELSRMLGGTVIEDQALIGRDLFMSDGASMGVAIQAKNVFLLRTSLTADRTKRAASDESITLKDITIAGKPVSFLSSPDNRVRSYMAEHGSVILVTNSKTIVERFFAVAEGAPSLADTASFRLSRQLMPLERQDSIFVYLSPAMLRGLVSPEYLIELRRRLVAKSDITLVHLARLAAAAEGNRETGIDQLAGLGFLPDGFGRRADGSGVISVDDTEVIDTMRGVRGTFLPIADAKITSVTQEESSWYQRVAAHYSNEFRTIDPIMIGVQREEIEGTENVERVTIHAEIAPWEPEKYGSLAKQLGPPTNVALKFAPDDIIAVQAHVASDQLGPPTHLFAAVKDSVPPRPEDFDGILNIYRSLQEIPGYLGAWPQPGALDRLPLGLGRGTPVGPNMNRLIGGLYRYTAGGYSILSFQPDILQASIPHISAINVEDKAQVRLHVGNFYGSRIEGWVNGQLYKLTSEGSGAGANYMGMLTRQLKVAPEDVHAAATRILGTPIQCTLGGQYEYSPSTHQWVSTAWTASASSQGAQLTETPPPGYVSPALKWFRGTDATLTQFDDRLVADAVIDIQR